MLKLISIIADTNIESNNSATNTATNIFISYDQCFFYLWIKKNDPSLTSYACN